MTNCATLPIFATFVVVSINFLATVRGQTCGIESRNSTVLRLPDNLTNDYLLRESESFNVGFVSVREDSAANSAYTTLRSNSSGQWVAVYLKKDAVDRNDFQRGSYLDFQLYLRCRDGTEVISDSRISVQFEDINNRAPEFAQLSYTFNVPLPWPTGIPITLTNTILVRDFDRTIANAQITVATSRPDLVNITTTSLLPTNRAYDYKVDLFASPNLLPGNYVFNLDANDGVHSAIVAVSMIVTEATCRAHLRNPVFGEKEKEQQIIYKATLSEFSKVGNILLLEDGVQKIEAYDPNELGEIDLTVDVDYLQINENGELVITRQLQLEEIKGMKSVIYAEITATERGTGKLQKVPLVLTVL